MGLFIQIHIDDGRMSRESAIAVASSCPVDIFALEGDRLVTLADQEDECTLCELCLEVAPAGVVTICKTYSDEKLVSRGNPRESPLDGGAGCLSNSVRTRE